MVVAMFIVGASFVSMGVGAPWIAEHGYRWGIGIKLGGTQSDPELWRRTHLLARRPFIYLGLVFLLIGLLFMFIPMTRDTALLVSLIAMPVTMVPVLVVATRLVERAKREIEEEKTLQAG